MRVLHSSDLHGRTDLLLAVTAPFDAWADTGDLLPNLHPPGTPDVAAAERAFQEEWLAGWLPRLREWLGGRPAVIVAGNHDFADAVPLLRGAGIDAHAVGPDGADVAGVRWAGFREIPWIDGTSMGEIRDFDALVDRTWAADPEVLLTHGPPAGTLDWNGRFGIPALGRALVERPGRIRAHLFGHEHRDGGREIGRGGIRFRNGAKAVGVVEV